MPLGRGWLTPLVDDSGGGTDGSPIDKDLFTDFADDIDATFGVVTPFSPVIGGSGGTSGQVYSTQVGVSIKHGRLVTAYGFVTLSTKGTITGDVQIQGFPTASDSTSNRYAIALIQWQTLATSYVSMGGYITPGATAITLTGITAAAGSSNTVIATAALNNNSAFLFSVSYIASS